MLMSSFVPKDFLLADTFYDRLRIGIKDEEKKLKPDEHLVAYFCSPAGEQMQVTDIGYHNPNLIIFYGLDSQQQECTILAHMNSVHLVLKIVKIDKSKERRKIGFKS